MEPRYSSERVRFLITARCPSLGWITGGNDRFISVANLWRLTGGVGLGVRDDECSKSYSFGFQCYVWMCRLDFGFEKSCRSCYEEWSRVSCAADTCRRDRLPRVGRWAPNWRRWRTARWPPRWSNSPRCSPSPRTSLRNWLPSWPLLPIGAAICAKG